MHESQPAAGQAEAYNAQLLNSSVCYGALDLRGAQLLDTRPVTVLDKVCKGSPGAFSNNVLIVVKRSISI
jgi:hypothetical protein